MNKIIIKSSFVLLAVLISTSFYFIVKADEKAAKMQEMEKVKATIVSQCRKDINSCDCSQIKDGEGRGQCELAIIEAKYQAEKEKQDKIRACTADLDKCDCSDISDASGRQECGSKVAEAKALKAKVKAVCEEDALNCDCSEIENAGGREQCETEKKMGMEGAENSVKEALSKCFKDVEKCDCSQLGLPKQSYVTFCEVQKTYGLNCKHEGTSCNKLEAVDIYPPGMPAWLGKFFARTYSSYIEKEKANGAKEAAGIIQNCLTDPGTCQCEKTPTYARAFCEKNKALQIKCEAGDYDACIILDKTPNLPEGVPSFSYSLLDKLVDGLRNARKTIIMSNATRKVGNMILACMDNAANCDCSLAPSGAIKSFCEHKKNLVELCRGKKQYEACFTLDEETNYPVETPGLIRSYIESNIVPQIEEKKAKIFNEMKKGTACDSIATLDECKKVYYKK